eukprot:93097-Prymnesium_polylepis.1
MDGGLGGGEPEDPLHGGRKDRAPQARQRHGYGALVGRRVQDQGARPHSDCPQPQPSASASP